MAIVSPEIYLGNIVKTRVRLARNLSGYPFNITDEKTARDIVKSVNRALIKCDTFNLLFTSNISNATLEAMKERHLISQNLIDNKGLGAVLVNTDESISVMIGEEDILREQCLMKGLRLKEAYEKISKVDDEIAKNLDIAFDEELGYLTACPSNLGTGLRASVMLFLPALTESGAIKKVYDEVSKMGLTVRGLYGEGSTAEGYLYQVSNEVTLGLNEYDILRQVEDTVLDICEAESNYARKLYTGKNELKTMDITSKSYGILTNAVLLSYSEFLQHIANVKLGAMLGVFNISELDKIDDLIISVRPANLCEQYGKRLSQIDRDLYRAEVVKNKLIKIKE